MEKTISLEEELLQLYLELHSLAPNQKNWSKEAFKDNPSRLYRYENMCAIAKSLNIHSIYFSIEKWSSDFIGKDQMRRWYDIETLARKNFNCRLGQIKSSDKLSIATIRNLFELLIKIALNYQSNITAKKQIINSSGFDYINLEISQNIAERDKKHLKDIAELLYLLINPNCITCPKSILIDEFGYKDIDFDDLDFEWL